MTFKKGDPRPPGAGRVKGKPTKKQIAAKARLDEIFASEGLNVEVELAKAVQRSDAVMARVLTSLLPYLQPRIATETVPAPKPETPAEQQPNDTSDLLALVSEPAKIQ